MLRSAVVVDLPLQAIGERWVNIFSLRIPVSFLPGRSANLRYGLKQ
jgi:hypothetical protein